MREDLKQELFIILCEKKEEFIQQLHESNGLKYYTVKILINLTRSYTSSFYKKYVAKDYALNDEHYLKVIEDPHEYETFVQNISVAVNNLHWYKSTIVKEYADKTLRAISKETGIPTSSIHLTIKEARKEVRKKVCG